MLINIILIIYSIFIKLINLFSLITFIAARSLAGNAEIVFCAYNYVVDPIIRRETLEIDV